MKKSYKNLPDKIKSTVLLYTLAALRIAAVAAGLCSSTMMF